MFYDYCTKSRQERLSREIKSYVNDELSERFLYKVQTTPIPVAPFLIAQILSNRQRALASAGFEVKLAGVENGLVDIQQDLVTTDKRLQESMTSREEKILSAVSNVLHSQSLHWHAFYCLHRLTVVSCPR